MLICLIISLFIVFILILYILKVTNVIFPEKKKNGVKVYIFEDRFQVRVYLNDRLIHVNSKEYKEMNAKKLNKEIKKAKLIYENLLIENEKSEKLLKDTNQEISYIK